MFNDLELFLRIEFDLLIRLLEFVLLFLTEREFLLTVLEVPLRLTFVDLEFLYTLEDLLRVVEVVPLLLLKE